ncbi:hypothetical protein [Lentzea fradiae]|nr:hypothetical protein [Lentzea fradiae]
MRPERTGRIARSDLFKKIAAEAKHQGADWKLVREGANHTVFELSA